MRFVYKLKAVASDSTTNKQKGGLYIPRNRSQHEYGVIQTGGGIAGFGGKWAIDQSLKSMREKMRKKQLGGSRAGGMGMFGYKHRRGTGWKPKKKSEFSDTVTDYIKDIFGIKIVEAQKARAKAEGRKYDFFKELF